MQAPALDLDDELEGREPEPRVPPAAIGDDYIAGVFDPADLLAKSFPSYEPREGQVTLAFAVHEAFNGVRHLLAEAPTGSGKSLAYSVPAIYHTTHSDQPRRAMIVTANIALQEQLVKKDLPLLKSVLPWSFDFALAKGIGNYLCLERFEETAGELVSDFGGQEAERWFQVQRWAASTKEGDISELPFEPGALRSKFTTTSDECLGRKCPHKDACHALRARGRAKDAHVVVTNYHLFFADLVLKRSGSAGVLPPYDYVIFDEGHKAPDIARDFFGFRLTESAIRWSVRLLDAKPHPKKPPLPKIDPALRARVMELAAKMFAELYEFSRTDEYQARLRSNYANPAPSWKALAQALVDAGGRLHEAAGYISGERKMELQKAAALCSAHADNLRAAMELHREEEVVYFIETSGKERDPRTALCSKPINVAELLRPALFEPDDRDLRPVAIVSATLSVADRFDFIACELGCESASELVAPSPFDWTRQCMLAIPGPLPEPNHADFPARAAEMMCDLVRASKGRALLLFTSYRQLEFTHRALLSIGLPYTILRQGERPRTQLLQQFRDDVSSVLCGTESFWAGVDVPGESLSLVAIDRIPFETPEDPVLDAIATHDRNWFRNYSVPRAVLAFRQGFGRLIRSRTDRGVVAVLDQRLITKGYGRLFTRSLPAGMPVKRRLADVEEFFR